MATLYVDRRGVELRYEQSTVVVRVDGEKPRRIPVRLLDRVVIHGGVMVSSTLLEKLAAAGVGVSVLSGRTELGCEVLGLGAGGVVRRVAQYRAVLNDDFSLRAARRLVAVKMRGHLRLVRRWGEERAEVRKACLDAGRTLRGVLAGVGQAGSLTTLLGMEGAGAAAFFEAYREMFANSLGFQGRNRRPPRDPVNAALSLGYTLWHGRVAQVLRRAGLDASLGFYHQAKHGRLSLASDILEVMRPAVEAWVQRLFAEQRLRRDHFAVDQHGACLLTKTGRERFYEAYEEFEGCQAGRLGKVIKVLLRVLRDWAPAEMEWTDEATIPDAGGGD